MSVVEGLRDEGKLEVQTKAYDFASYTHKICSNQKVFFKRYRWCSTSKIIDAVDDICVYIDLANQVNIRKDLKPENLKKNKELRKQYQTKAIEVSIRLETLMEIAYRNNRVKSESNPTTNEISQSEQEKEDSSEVGISKDKFYYWVGLLLEVRSLIRKWRDSEQG